MKSRPGLPKARQSLRKRNRTLPGGSDGLFLAVPVSEEKAVGLSFHKWETLERFERIDWRIVDLQDNVTFPHPLQVGIALLEDESYRRMSVLGNESDTHLLVVHLDRVCPIVRLVDDLLLEWVDDDGSVSQDLCSDPRPALRGDGPVMRETHIVPLEPVEMQERYFVHVLRPEGPDGKVTYGFPFYLRGNVFALVSMLVETLLVEDIQGREPKSNRASSTWRMNGLTITYGTNHLSR